MTGKPKRYSAEFRAKVALEALRGELTVSQLVAKHGVHQTLINAWKKQAMALAPLLHPNLPEVYRRKVAHLHTLLEQPDTKVEAMDLIRSLVEAIVLTPEDGTLRVDLRGELAAILGLCADSKKPGAVSGAGLLEQVKMVAGAGFEPATFRL